MRRRLSELQCAPRAQRSASDGHAVLSEIEVDWSSFQGKLGPRFMKQILVLLCLATVLLQSGCAISPPIDQQTLDEQKHAQAEKRSDVFARGLSQ
jgi:hypothetical protein